MRWQPQKNLQKMKKKSKDINEVNTDSIWSRNSSKRNNYGKMYNGKDLQKMLGIEDEGPQFLNKASGLTMMDILDQLFTDAENEKLKDEETEEDE